MTQLDLKKQRERLQNWIELLQIFPAESKEGKLRDHFWSGRLEGELEEIEQQLSVKGLVNSLGDLSRVQNKLRELIR